MLNIEVVKNTFVITNDQVKTCYPLNAIFLISNDESDIVNVRLKANRKNINTFRYQEVGNIQANSANEMIEKISLMANK